LPIAPLESGRSNVILASGDLQLDLTQAQVSFADPRSGGEALAKLARSREIAFLGPKHLVAAFGYLVQPARTTVSGALRVSMKLPTSNGSYDYVPELGDWVAIVALDPVALQLVPVGVGRVDPARLLIESRGVLDIRRLDFIGVVFSKPAQASLEAYANGELDLAQLNSALMGAAQ
jgi:hypothetical protein